MSISIEQALQRHNNIYTIEDMMLQQDCKDKVIIVYDHNKDRECITIGLENTSKSMIHSIIKVYCPETDEIYLANIAPKNVELAKDFKIVSDKNLQYKTIIGLPEDKVLEVAAQHLQFLKQHKRTFDLAICINSFFAISEENQSQLEDKAYQLSKELEEMFS